MKRVLVIEDNPDNLRLISYALEKSGYSVVPAESGEEGASLAIRLRPAFVIVDIDLPDIDGLEVARRIRRSEEGGTLPLVAITSYAMAGDRRRCIAAGCNAYFEKPIDPLTIVARIEQVIGIGK